MRSLRCVLVVLALFGGCSSGRDGDDTSAAREPAAPDELGLEVVAEHPHDPRAFSQGLVFAGDRLFESTGGYGTSDVREVDPETGEVLRSVALPGVEFAEGLAYDGEALRQLTWKEGTAHSWTLGLEPGNPASYEGEGWGLAFDEGGDRWVQSDGSGTLTFRDADSFEATGAVRVRRGGTAVDELNELEVVGDALWANVWHSTELLRIDLDSGAVTATVDATELVPRDLDDPEAVLNGIAHRPGDPPGRLWLTGKRWPTTYVVDVG